MEKPERETTDMIGLTIFMTHFLAEVNVFCVKHIVEDRTLMRSVDLVILGVGEIVGVSMRIDDFDQLIGASKANELDTTQTTGTRTSPCTSPYRGSCLGMECFIAWLMGEVTSATSASTPRPIDAARGHCHFPENHLHTALC